VEENSLISVIIPAYNTERYIEETINSVLQQSYSNIEVIIVDDGSTDNTAGIIKRFLPDTRIQYVHQKNSGVSNARNYGFKLSKGKYTAFLDADDLWHKDFLRRKAEILDKDETTGIVVSDGCAIDEKSIPLSIFYKGPEEPKKIIELNCDSSLISSALIRRSIMEKTNGFDPQLSNAADKLFTIEAGLLAKMISIKGCPFYYRLHVQNMHKDYNLMIRDYITLFNAFDKKNIYDNENHKKDCWSRMYKACAGECFRNKEYLRGFIFLFKSFLKSPTFLLKEGLNAERIRKLIFKLIYSLGIGHLLYFINRSLNRIPILVFHKVDLEDDKFWSSVHPYQFDQVIQFMKTKYRLITLEELLSSSKKSLRNTAVITFDDAYKNFYDYAFPILDKHKVPATVFVPVKSIMQNAAIWTSQIVTCFKYTNKTELKLNIGGKDLHLRFNNEKERIAGAIFLLNLLQEVSSHEQAVKTEEIKSQLEYIPEKDLQMMSWSEITELKNKIDFQSHSMSHPCLDKVENEEDLVYELKESKAILSDKLARDVKYIAYPIGKYSSHVEEVAGKFYDAAFAVDNKLVELKKLNDPSYRFRIPRYNISDTSVYEIFLRINGFHKLFRR
jgi:glycosyltransferase involved in cell wall biosynthesis/peptidoglycan/xylan/chitin deacetylase (PgdA/CDA1 family)